MGLVDDQHRAASKVRRVTPERMTRKADARLHSMGRPSSQPMDLYISITLPVDSGT